VSIGHTKLFFKDLLFSILGISPWFSPKSSKHYLSFKLNTLLFSLLLLYIIIRMRTDIIQKIIPILFKICMQISHTSLGYVSIPNNFGNNLYPCHIAYLAIVALKYVSIIIGILPQILPFTMITILNLHFTFLFFMVTYCDLVIDIGHIVNIFIPALSTISTINLACTIESFQACRANILMTIIGINWSRYSRTSGQS